MAGPALHRCSQAALVLALAGWFSAMAGRDAGAAEIGFAHDLVFDCGMQVRGVIEAGDAARIAEMVDSPKMREGLNDPNHSITPRICLDSPGGSFAEAFRIARVIYSRFGTAVRKGERCESACAIVFMAGSISPEDDRGVVADRVLHPLARLGFHSPSLVVPEGSYDEAVVNKAYNVAVAGIGELVGVSGYLKFPATLIEAMLQTPPDQMMHVETVGQSARWQIGVAPTVELDALTNLGVINACNNWYQFKTDIITVNGFFDADKSRILAMSKPVISRSGDTVTGKLEGFEQEAASACSVSMEQYSKRPVATVGWVSIGDEVGAQIYPSALFSRDTPIAALVRADDKVRQTVALSSLSAPWEEKSLGECFVFDGAQMIDHERCTRVETRSADEALSARTVTNFVWPSGGKTVLVTDGTIDSEFGEEAINGAATEMAVGEVEEGHGPAICNAATYRSNYRCEFSCWPNSNTGKDFCFLDYAFYDRPLSRWEPPAQ